MVLKEVKEACLIIKKVKEGKWPKSSFGRNVLVREGVIKFKDIGKKFGEGKFILTTKGRKLSKACKFFRS